MITQANNPLSIWLPDIHFIDATNVNTIVNYLKIKSGGELAWSRHIQLEVAEALFGTSLINKTFFRATKSSLRLFLYDTLLLHRFPCISFGCTKS